MRTGINKMDDANIRRIAQLREEVQRLKNQLDKANSELSKAKEETQFTDIMNNIQDMYLIITQKIDDLSRQIEEHTNNC